MTTPATDAAEIEQRLKAVIDYVRDCETRVNRGEVMDLQGLDRNVIEICNAITSLPSTEARVLEAKMSSLINGLDQLAIAMKAQQDSMNAFASGAK